MKSRPTRMSEVELSDIRALLGEVLGSGNSLEGLGPDAALLGAIPEFDSLAVVQLLEALQSRYGIAIDEAELDVSDFETLGSLQRFVSRHGH